jgi:hypothetical protein
VFFCDSRKKSILIIQMDFTIIGIICLIALGIRLFSIYNYKDWFKQGFIGDSSVHFTIVRQLKKDLRALYIDQFLISPEPMAYPTAFHRFSRLFSTSLLIKRPYLPNLFLYVVFSSIFCIYLIYLKQVVLSGKNLTLFGGFLVYFICPSSFIFDGPSIAYIKLSERFLARASCALAISGLWVAIVFNDVISFAAAVCFGVLAILTSIFARQALMFTLPLLCIFFLDLRPIVMLVVVLALGAVVGRRRFLHSLRHTINHWRCYRIFTKQSSIVRQSLTCLFRWHFAGGRITIRSTLGNIINRDPTRTFFYYPEIFLSIVLLYFSTLNFYEVYRFFLPIGITLIVYFTTLTDRWNHFGEAYRYIEYNLFFQIPIICGVVSGYTSPLYLKWIYCVYVFFVFITVGILLYASRKNRRYEADELLAFLDQLPIRKNAIVFPISMRLGPDLVARRWNWKTFWWQPGVQLDSIFNEFIEEYPYLKKNWWPLFERFGVTHVICDKLALKACPFQYDFSKLQLISENDHYIAYRVATNSS